MTDATWEVFVLEYARGRAQPVVDLINGTAAEGVMDTPFAFVMARSGGRVALVDTGFMREGIGEEMARRFAIPDWVSPLRLLEELGVGPDDVTDIVLSHAHFDHMGSIHRFPRARLWIQKAELLSWHEAMALPPRFGYLTAIINPDDLRAMFDASVEHRVTLLEGDRDHVLPGLHARWGPGHTIGQQFVALDTARGTVVVSGDCVYGAANLKGHGGDGVYVPLNNAVGSVWDQLKTIDRIDQAIGGDLSRLVILHDVGRWAGFETVAEVEGFRIARVA
jgi:glyoxylase-like metal-dependent hydrolase (beta-lactamase superfamily II)